MPVIFVVENNGYAESTSVDYATGVDSYIDRASSFGLPVISIDGTDFFAVYEAAGEIIRRAREGGGPSLLESKMIRFFGHFEGDAQTYRITDFIIPRDRGVRKADSRRTLRLTRGGEVVTLVNAVYGLHGHACCIAIATRPGAPPASRMAGLS